jgi:hypothetical protein
LKEFSFWKQHLQDKKQFDEKIIFFLQVLKSTQRPAPASPRYTWPVNQVTWEWLPSYWITTG